MQDKFSIAEIITLRGTLIEGRLDSFQLAESIQMFVTTHGYGLSPDTARDVASQLEGARYNVHALHRHLERSALMM